jgi:hypothetical protein
VFVVISIVVLILAFVSAQTPSATGDEAGLYKTRCAIWHEPDRTGMTPSVQKLDPRDLHFSAAWKQLDSDLLRVVAQGTGEMPAS